MKTKLFFSFILCFGMLVVKAQLPAITGNLPICVGSTNALSNATTGGTWSSTNTTIATVGSSSGIVTGVASGTAIISYIATGGYAIATVTVNPVPAAITGTTSVCVGLTKTLSNATAGGTWSSSDGTVATAGTSGIVTGLAAGTTTISYTLGTGCYATTTFTVTQSLPSIVENITHGTTITLCVSSTITAICTTGTSWTSSNPSVATIGVTSGVISGLTTGTTTITFTATNNCIQTNVATVSPNPSAITGSAAVCLGATTLLSNSATGGTWVSNTPSVATIGSSSGIVTGISTGLSTITYNYTLATGCKRIVSVTVNPLPSTVSASGSGTYCGSTSISASGGGAGTSIYFQGTTSGGTSTSFGGTPQTVTSSGTYYFRARNTTTGCWGNEGSVSVTINPLPGTISGTKAVCAGLTTTLSNSAPGGTWSSSNTSVATIGSSSGIVTGISAGTAGITYILATGCGTATAVVTVNPLPAAITGTASVCAGSTTTLSDATPTGTWSSSDAGTASIGSATGIVTGVSAGTATITYTISTGCIQTQIVTVNPLPAGISGTIGISCSLTTTLSDATAGGTWSSSNTTIATIGAGTGIVSAITPGTTIITYALSTGCYTITTVTVSPPVISGSSAVCSGSAITLTGAPSAGSWSSSNTGVATINSSGVVSGVSGNSGTATISYTISGACYTTETVTVGKPFTVSVCETAPIAICDSIVSYCSGFALTVTGAPAGSVFYWASSSSDSLKNHYTASSSGTTEIFTFASAPTGGVYTVSVISPGGCVTTATLHIVVASGGCYPCESFRPQHYSSSVCASCDTVATFITVPGNKLTSTYISTTTPNYYYIPSTTTSITNDTLMVSPAPGSVLLMGEFVALYVRKTDAITLRNCHLFSSISCSDGWNGINILVSKGQAGSLTIDSNTLIEDVTDPTGAIVVTGDTSHTPPSGGNILLSNKAIYNKNSTGVHIMSSNYYAAQPFIFKSSIFSERDFSYYHLSTDSANRQNYFPFTWPDQGYLKTPAGTGSPNNPDFNIDNYPVVFKSATGIYLNQVDSNGDTAYGMTIGDPNDSSNTNLFDTMAINSFSGTGVTLQASNVTFYNNIFRRTAFGGSGIKMISVDGNSVQIIKGAVENTYNTFYNCFYAVNGDGANCYNFTSLYTVMKSTNYFPVSGTRTVHGFYGIFLVGGKPYGTHLIEYNTMRNIALPISDQLGSCDSTDKIIIKYNDMTGLLSDSTFESDSTGIIIQDNSTCTPANAVLQICSNYIAGFKEGIQLGTPNSHYSAFSTTVDSNTIIIRNNDVHNLHNFQRYGIDCTRFRYINSMSHNEIYGDTDAFVNYATPATGYDADRGILGYNGMFLTKIGTSSFPATVSANYIHDIPVAFNFIDTSVLTWTKNTMKRNKYGMTLSLYYDVDHSNTIMAQIGNQGDTCKPSDNIWDGDSTSTWPGWKHYKSSDSVFCTYAYGEDPAMESSRLYTSANPSSTPPYYTPLLNGTRSSHAAGVAYTPGVSLIDPAIGGFSFSVGEIAPYSVPAADSFGYISGLILQITGAQDPAIYIWNPSISGYTTSGYTASGGIGTTTYTFTSTPAFGTYTVTAINAYGCSDTIRVKIESIDACSPVIYFKVHAFCSTAPCIDCDTTVSYRTITDTVLDSSNITSDMKYYNIKNSAVLKISPYPGSIFYMGSGVKLTVRDSIVLDSCHFFSSPTCNWDGIFVGRSGSAVGKLTIEQNTLIENADSGVYCENIDSTQAPAYGYIIKSNGAIYNRNAASIYISNCGAPQAFEIKKSIFTSRDFSCYHANNETLHYSDCYPFSWPTANYLKTPNTSTGTANDPGFNIDSFPAIHIPFITGISLSTVVRTIPGTPNIYYTIPIGDSANACNTNMFDTLENGVYALNSNMLFYNNIFRHTNANGIFAQNTSSNVNKNTLQSLKGSSDGTHNRFYNCTDGIQAAGYFNFSSHYTLMSATNSLHSPSSFSDRSDYGYFLTDSAFDNYEMINDTISNIATGFDVTLATNTVAGANGNIVISNNTLNGLVSSSSFEDGNVGILIFDVPGTTSSSNGNVYVSNNTISGWATGILVNSRDVNVNVDSNTIVLKDNSSISQRFGIRVRTSANINEVTHNDIYGDTLNGVTYNLPLPATSGASDTGTLLNGLPGMFFQGVVNTSDAPTLISCNSVHDMNIGFQFEEINNLNWKNNSMTHNRYGMLLIYYLDAGTPHPGIISTQGGTCSPGDNTWDGNATPSWPGWGGITTPAIFSSDTIYQTFVLGEDPSAETSSLYVRENGATPPYYTPVYNGTRNFNLSHTGTAYTLSASLINSSPDCEGTYTACMPSSEKMQHGGGSQHTGDQQANIKYTIMPNPSNGNIEIRQVGATQIGTINARVFSAIGETVYNGNLTLINGASALKLNNAAPGIYLLEITDEKGNKSNFKLVIEK